MGRGAGEYARFAALAFSLLRRQPGNMKLKFFVSHATEDQADFVLPLVEALKDDFEVWYAPYNLTLGDSLLQKINQGLRDCDYGIVVLSPAFFSKRWPQAELDGLFALETENRKVILPIWKDVDAEDVKRFSPILAGRLAARAADGLDSVINLIKQTVGVAERVASFSGLAAAKARLMALDQQNVQHAAATHLANSVKGVQLAEQAAVALCNALAENFTSLQSELAAFKFDIARKEPLIFQINAPYLLGLHVRYWNQVINALSEARLTIILYQRSKSRFEEDKGAQRLRELSYAPWFDSGGSIVWRQDKDHSYSNEQLVEAAVNLLIDKISEFQKTSK